MTKKINWLLVVQGWTMLLVIAGHAPFDIHAIENGAGHPIAGFIFKFAYSFHMPMFIFISGYLFFLTRIKKTMPYTKMVHDKLTRFGIPFVFFTAIALVLKSVFSQYMSRPANISFVEFLNAFVHPNDGPMREFWFLATIMWLFMFAPVFHLLLKNIWLTLSGIIIYLVLHYIPMLNLDYFCFERALRYSIFFFLGMCFCRYDIERLFDKQLWLTFVVFVMLYALSHAFNQAVPLVTTLLGFNLSIALAKVLDRILPKSFFSFRNYTYQIFLMGIFFQIFVKILYNSKIAPNYYMPMYILCILIGLYLPVLIAKIVEKINIVPLSLTIGLSAKEVS